MKLHLMVSFRTHFRLRDEEINTSPSAYADFWEKASTIQFDKKEEVEKIIFLHKVDENASERSRFRFVENDSLSRPLHALEFHVHPGNPILEDTWRHVVDTSKAHRFELDLIKLVSESASVRIYNNSVGLLQIDLDISHIFDEKKEEDVTSLLDTLQDRGILFGEKLSQAIYHKSIKPCLDSLITDKDLAASRFVAIEYFSYESALEKAIITQNSSRDKQMVKVNWVTRTLLVEPGDNGSEDKESKLLKAVVGHWLKDCGDSDTIANAQNDSGACAIRWLNYVFRENAYEWQTNEGKKIEYSLPFSDKWQAMLNAQYYYAAFEALNDTLKSTLSLACQRKNRVRRRAAKALRGLNRILERDVITANLTMLEYYNNYGYYNRQVSATMKEIMDGWKFDKAILDQIRRNADLCRDRIEELNQKAQSRSSFYSDCLLLGIAVVSVVAFLFQIIEYGRNVSLDADLSVYESNSLNIIEFLSEKSSDYIIFLSLLLIVLLFVLYAWFRRATVMD